MEKLVPLAPIARERTILGRIRKAAVVLVVLGIGLLLVPAPGDAQLRDFDSLPDWSGVWAMVGGTVFDRATWTGGGRSLTKGARAHPPFNAEWEAIYQRNLELRDQDLFPDPLTNCGVPSGFPRIFNIPGCGRVCRST